jgi:gamma-glutamyl-gamma-aminobutyrate hydrolase PuuD
MTSIPFYTAKSPHPTTVCDPKRDEDDIALYLLCLEHGIPMFGVCRGAQFLHVMNGGKLWQHVDRHYGDHRIYDIKKRDFVQKVSSVHHQMVRLNTDNGMELIATNGDARNRWANPTERAGAKADIEVFFYRDTCCLGVQGHPEYAGLSFLHEMVLDLINETILSFA